MPEPFLETERLIVADFQASHLDGLAAMNGDVRVMEYFPAVQTAAESAAFLQRIIDHRQQHGFSLYALHLKDNGRFIGFTGLLAADFEAAFTPAVEVGWRLLPDVWGRGLAVEAAAAVCFFGFHSCGLDEIVSFTALQNRRSVRVMEKLGMQRNAADDFDHPHLPAGHNLQRHVLYRLRSNQ